MKKQPWGILMCLLGMVLSPCFLESRPRFAKAAWVCPPLYSVGLFLRHPACVAESNSMTAYGVILLVFWIVPRIFK